MPSLSLKSQALDQSRGLAYIVAVTSHFGGQGPKLPNLKLAKLKKNMSFWPKLPNLMPAKSSRHKVLNEAIRVGHNPGSSVYGTHEILLALE